jgi:hypothetical protein
MPFESPPAPAPAPPDEGDLLPLQAANASTLSAAKLAKDREQSVEVGWATAQIRTTCRAMRQGSSASRAAE